MTQPFRNGNESWRSVIWPELQFFSKEDHLVMQSERAMNTVSSALWRGGTCEATHFINGSVPLDFNCDDPMEMMKEFIDGRGYPVEKSVGLLTAAKLSHASFHAKEGDHFRMIACATAGTGNSARAGLKRETFSAYQAGTINVFVFIDATLTPAAMVNGIMTATEAKCAALQDLQIVDRKGGIATGTTSDAIVLASQPHGLDQGFHAFAGTATTIGYAIGRLVYKSVYEAVVTQNSP
ncbi:adenosylcobinamide amidohydrolase [Brevibacillus sp. SYSU BS000544]|uniref:adenosylcobinamide amidohydrolase n=1 Tax=Brevibacillus sp. SYSU BS000544 TaxID=3416443 RepID=UPI003CE59D03